MREEDTESMEEQLAAKVAELERLQAEEEAETKSDPVYDPIECKEEVKAEPAPIYNSGWEYIAKMVGDEYDILTFAGLFNRWQRQAILLTEITYAEEYTYVTPLGAFTHIGTLARALQYIFEKDWNINATLIGDELRFLADKGIKGAHYSFVCKFIELDQASSDKYCDGWKLGSGEIAPKGIRIGTGQKLIMTREGDEMIVKKW